MLANGNETGTLLVEIKSEFKDIPLDSNRSREIELLETLAGSIAHDFNNLLVGIEGYVYLSLLALDIDHPSYENLRKIREIVMQGAYMTSLLLEFSQGAGTKFNR